MKQSCHRQMQTVVVLTYAIAILQSCTSYYPRYTGGAPSTEPHEVERCDKPQYVEGINVFGWTFNLAVAGGSAYAAYAYAPVAPTRDFLANEGVSLSNDQVRVAHAVTAGLVTGLITFAIITGNVGRRPVVNTEDATRWLSDYNSRRKLVEFARNDFIRSIPTDADERYVMRNLEDARFFAQLFPNSSHAEEVILRSLVNIPVSDQDDLVAIFPNLGISAKIKQQLIMDATTVSQWLTLNQQYPGVINQQDRELTASKLRTIIKNFNDVKVIKQANPTYVSIDTLQDLGIPYMASLADITKFQATFPQGSRESALYAIALQRIAGLRDAVAVKRMFVKSAADQQLDSLAYGAINSMQDVVLFGKEFPKSAQVALLPESALQYVSSPQDLIDYAKLFPSSDAIDERVQRFEPRLSRDEAQLLARNIPNTSRRSNLVAIYLDKSTDLTSAIEASREYPGNEDMLADKVVSKLVKPGHYRMFLEAFGETAAAVEARGKYQDLISQSPENLGTGVNTIYSEYGPEISPDGKTRIRTGVGISQVPALRKSIRAVEESSIDIEESGIDIEESGIDIPVIADGEMKNGRTKVVNEGDRSYAAADAELNRVYKSVLADLTPAQQEEWRRAQQQWIPYRDSSCAKELAAYKGSPNYSRLLGTCKADRTRVRTRVIIAYAKQASGLISPTSAQQDVAPSTPTPHSNQSTPVDAAPKLAPQPAKAAPQPLKKQVNIHLDGQRAGGKKP